MQVFHDGWLPPAKRDLHIINRSTHTRARARQRQIQICDTLVCK